MRPSVHSARLAALLLALGLFVPAPSSAQGGTVAPAAPLQPGDVVRLKIWREPDLSGDFTVDQEGTVTLPRLGPRLVTALPPDSVRAGILRDFRRLLTSPSIAVEFIRRVSVGGGVYKPGVYQVDEVMTVADVITMAGGAQRPDVETVSLVRNGVATGRKLELSARLSSVPVLSGDELRVPRIGWVQRNYQMVYIGISSLLAISTIYSVTRR